MDIVTASMTIVVIKRVDDVIIVRIVRNLCKRNGVERSGAVLDLTIIDGLRFGL